MRSDGRTNGDEPKYVRYCENLYQGLGFDISEIKPMSQLPADFRPKVWRNVVLLAEIMPRELRGLASDVFEYIRNPSHRFNRARHREGGFLEGKNGGAYQVHNPGISLLIFPAYYVDRRLATIEPGSPAQWPEQLRAVHAFSLAMLALWTILIFRFLRRCGATSTTSWIATLAFTLTLPVTNFPFQYYPELAAGLFVSAVGGHLLFADRRKAVASFFYGLLAGYLPWFHVRFAGVTAALAFAAVVLWRGDRRRASIFMAGLVIPVALFCMYAYRVTGSALPSALWSAEGSDANFAFLGMIKNSAAYLVDREWGLFAYSPLYLLVLPGYWLMARRKPTIAWVNALILFSLLLPAAGKTLVQTTPMRLITAVVPFGATPLIEMLERRGARAIQVVFGLLLILSLDNALAYNLHHYREVAPLVDWSFSGWKVNLLFPKQSRWPFQVSAANGALLIVWLVALVALALAPAVIERMRRGGRIWPHLPAPSSPARLAFAGSFALVAIGTVVSAATGVWADPRYRIPANEAARQAAVALDDVERCTICMTSTRGRIDTDTLLAELETVDPAARLLPQAVARQYREWVAMLDRIREWHVAANGDEPASEIVSRYMYDWHEQHVGPAEIRRRIFAAGRKMP